MRQIAEAGYADKYKSCGKRIVAIGAEFSTAERRLTTWVTG